MAALTELYYTPSQTMLLAEWHVYGSSRVGIYKANKPIAKTINETIVAIQYQTRIKYRYNGNKQYELSNHLGNVLVTISDRRKAICNNQDSTLSYSAVVVTATDYYSFGSPMVGRSYEGDTSLRYRYGFNGKEKDDETYGEGNELDFGARVYDGRLGRWLSVDNLLGDYSFISPYTFSKNSPVFFIDLDGNKFINPYTNKIEGAKIRKANAQEALDNFAKNNPTVNKNATIVRRLFSKEYRQKFKLERELNYATNELETFQKNELEVDNLLYTLKVVDEKFYNKFETLTNPDGSDVNIIIELNNESRTGKSNQSAQTQVKFLYNRKTGDKYFQNQRITLFQGEGLGGFANELGDIEFALEKLLTSEDIEKYKNSKNDYFQEPTTKYSYEKEGFIMKKYNDYLKNNKISKKDLDDRGSLKEVKTK